jgi:hypothetical protein
MYEFIVDLFMFENISLILDSSVRSGLFCSLLMEFLIFNNHNKKFSFDSSASSNDDILSLRFFPHDEHGKI